MFCASRFCVLRFFIKRVFPFEVRFQTFQALHNYHDDKSTPMFDRLDTITLQSKLFFFFPRYKKKKMTNHNQGVVFARELEAVSSIPITVIPSLVASEDLQIRGRPHARCHRCKILPVVECDTRCAICILGVQTPRHAVTSIQQTLRLLLQWDREQFSAWEKTLSAQLWRLPDMVPSPMDFYRLVEKESKMQAAAGSVSTLCLLGTVDAVLLLDKIAVELKRRQNTVPRWYWEGYQHVIGAFMQSPWECGIRFRAIYTTYGSCGRAPTSRSDLMLHVSRDWRSICLQLIARMIHEAENGIAVTFEEKQSEMRLDAKTRNMQMQ